jgi:hypothetical protein
MNTAHNLRVVHDPDDQDPETLGALQRGAGPADPTEHNTDGADWRAETIATQLEPESQLIGALMWLPAACVRRILELVPDTAIWRPMNRWAYVMYSRTLFASPTDGTFGGRLRRWTVSPANPRLQTLDSQRQLSAAEIRRMICATSIDTYPDCGFDTYLVGRCVDRTKYATRDLARMNLHRAVNWEAVR